MTSSEKLNILIVDDKKENLLAITCLLEDFDVNIVTSTSGNEALAKVLKYDFVLVLMDVQMPVMDGFETATIMHAQVKTPIIFITAIFPEKKYISKGYEAGAVDYLLKPIDPQILRSKVKVFLDLYEQKRLLENEIKVRKQAENTIKELNESLERRVIERTEELRESEMKYGILAQTSPVGMWHTDANGDCLYVNERWCEITGLTVEDALHDGWAQNLHPDDRDRVFKEWHDTAKNKQDFKSEYRFTLPNGTTTWVYGQAIPEIDKNGVVVGYVGTITDITERKKFEDQISSSLKEKDVLLKEIHHRVKNNMQVITSLLRLQSERIEDKQLHDIFLESQNRIKSMALIHEELYISKDLTSIEFYHITRNLISSIMRSYEIGPGRITVNMTGNEVLLDVNKAVPCGLIINELVSNSLNHAFPEGKKGELKISMCKVEGPSLADGQMRSKMELIISDNGVGLPEDMDFKSTKTLGLELINTLVQQLNGTIELNRTKGAEFKIVFDV